MLRHIDGIGEGAIVPLQPPSPKRQKLERNSDLHVAKARAVVEKNRLREQKMQRSCSERLEVLVKQKVKWRIGKQQISVAIYDQGSHPTSNHSSSQAWRRRWR